MLLKIAYFVQGTALQTSESLIFSELPMNQTIAQLVMVFCLFVLLLYLLFGNDMPLVEQKYFK